MPWRPPWPKRRVRYFNTATSSADFVLRSAARMLYARGDQRYINYFNQHYYDIRDQVIESLSRPSSFNAYGNQWPRWRRMTPDDFTRRVSVIVQHVEFEVHDARMPPTPPRTPPQEGVDEYDD